MSGRLAHVAAFIALFGGLFLLSWGGLRSARRDRRNGADIRRLTLRILLFAALFRLLLVPAGLGTQRGPWQEATPDRLSPAALVSRLADDLAGREVAYDEHLLYDDDVWRYLWDGHVAAGALNPYVRSPQEIVRAAEEGGSGAAETQALLSSEPWWDVVDRVGFPGYRTVYPPAAQLLFRLTHALAPASVAAWKLLVALLDLGTCLLLARVLDRLGRPREEVLLYAWNPLAVKELAGSGHVDALMIFLVVLAVERLLGPRGEASRSQIAGLAAWAGAVAAKLGAAVLAPLVARRTRARWWWVPATVVALLCLPYLEGLPALAGALAVFGREWQFNAGAWGLAARVAEAAGAANPRTWADAVTKGPLLALVLVTAWNAGRADDRRFVHAGFVALGAAVLLSPTVMPWYLLWALPLAVAAGYRSWSVLTGLSLLSYLIYATHAEAAWWRWVEHGGFAVALAWELRARPRLASELRALLARPKLGTE